MTKKYYEMVIDFTSTTSAKKYGLAVLNGLCSYEKVLEDVLNHNILLYWNDPAKTVSIRVCVDKYKSLGEFLNIVNAGADYFDVSIEDVVTCYICPKTIEEG